VDNYWSTDSIGRLECSEELDTNQGTDIIMRRVMDWNACIVRIWDGLAQPQIWIPYAHIGCKRFLFLFYIDIVIFKYKRKVSKYFQLDGFF